MAAVAAPRDTPGRRKRIRKEPGPCVRAPFFLGGHNGGTGRKKPRITPGLLIAAAGRVYSSTVPRYQL